MKTNEIISAISERKDQIRERMCSFKVPHASLYIIHGPSMSVISHQYYETTYGVDCFGIARIMFEDDAEKVLKRYSNREVLDELSKPVIDNEFVFCYKDYCCNSRVTCDFEGNVKHYVFTSADDALECVDKNIYMRIKLKHSDKEWCK